MRKKRQFWRALRRERGDNRSTSLSEKEMRKIREQAGSKKSKKGKKSRRRKHH